KRLMNRTNLARVVAGCTAISVHLLSASFIVAVSSQFKTTFFDVLAGSGLIYTFKLLHIGLLSMGLYHYPSEKEILHTVVFPAIIYGMVFLLWVFWVNRFSKLKH